MFYVVLLLATLGSCGHGTSLPAPNWAQHRYRSGHVGTGEARGLLYYSLANMFPDGDIVCIGSGDGFVPQLLAHGRATSSNPGGRTILVDLGSDLGPDGVPLARPSRWGETSVHDMASPFRQSFAGEVWKMTSQEAATHFEPGSISYLHIDGDHSFSQSLRDFENFLPLMATQFAITLHDTAIGHLDFVEDGCVARTVALLRERISEGAYPDLELLDFNMPTSRAAGHVGTAVIKRRSRNRFDASESASAVRSGVVNPAQQWLYLTARPFSWMRQLTAAGVLAHWGIRTVLEIGSYHTPVCRVMSANSNVEHVLVEPGAATACARAVLKVCAVAETSCYLPAAVTQPGPRALVALGIGYDLTPLLTKESLVHLDLIILEAASTWQEGSSHLKAARSAALHHGFQLISDFEMLDQEPYSSLVEPEKHAHQQRRHVLVLSRTGFLASRNEALD